MSFPPRLSFATGVVCDGFVCAIGAGAGAAAGSGACTRAAGIAGTDMGAEIGAVGRASPVVIVAVSGTGTGADIGVGTCSTAVINGSGADTTVAGGGAFIAGLEKSVIATLGCTRALMGSALENTTGWLGCAGGAALVPNMSNISCVMRASLGVSGSAGGASFCATAPRSRARWFIPEWWGSAPRRWRWHEKWCLFTAK